MPAAKEQQRAMPGVAIQTAIEANGKVELDVVI